MSKINRRNFLKLSAIGLGGLTASQILAACSQLLSPATPSAPPAATPAPVSSPTQIPSTGANTAALPGATDTVPAPTQAPPSTQTPMSIPDMAVARGGQQPEALVRSAIAALGGMERFVSKGASVIIKPNICVAYHPYQYAATTNPWVVAGLVKMCLEAGAGKVQVMDNPFGGTEDECYASTGIKAQVEAAGGQMAYMPLFKYTTVPIPNGVAMKQINLFGDILTADVVINVPIAKTHDLAGLTLGMKNLMGIVRDRPAMHGNINQKLADLTSLVRPKLTVVDAVRILVANGPTGGSLSDVKELDTVIASPDIVAADSYATTLFGMHPEDLPCIPAAVAMGLGRSDLNNMKIEEIPVGG